MDGAPRISLRQTRLDPRRQAIRRGLLAFALGVTVLVMILLLFEEHETQFRSWHAIRGEDLEHALVVWGAGAAVCGLLALALRFGFAIGILAGVATGLGGSVMFLATAVVHLLSDVTHNAAGNAVLLGSLLLCALGLAIVVVELLLRVIQRAENRGNALPRAVVVTK